MKNVKIFLLNDTSPVTDYYVSIIESAFTQMGYTAIRTKRLNDIIENDTVVTIDVRGFYQVYKLHLNVVIYNWFQGITPEEIYFIGKKTIKSFLRKKWHEHLERLCLKYSKGNFFVSEAMCRHFKEKYGYSNINYYIMPCFNQEISMECFTEAKYKSPNFVYTGGIGWWHCFPQTLMLFKKIKEVIPAATLTIFTSAQEEAKKIISEYGICDANVSSYSNYQDAIKKLAPFKYGFLLREDNVINNVATPTKMSTYLGCGIIPIFSPVIHEFVKQFDGKPYFVSANDIKTTVNAIRKIEQTSIKTEDIINVYKDIFNGFYSRDSHIKAIKRFISILN